MFEFKKNDVGWRAELDELDVDLLFLRCSISLTHPLYITGSSNSSSGVGSGGSGSLMTQSIGGPNKHLSASHSTLNTASTHDMMHSKIPKSPSNESLR